jgi:hypothetical protein
MRYRRGSHEPPAAVLVRLGEALDVSPDVARVILRMPAGTHRRAA